ncbi:hypothetical protein [Methylosinus sporium]|uniref:hypothetical protein n=1 Tax=Methylosinus sporium TaxID=428 RepID=UPI001FED5D6A|nr:hypothetical protein [Methylosinus sporium]
MLGALLPLSFSGRRLRQRGSIACEGEDSLDLRRDEIAMARLVERGAATPAHEDEALAGAHALGELFGRGGHRPAAREVGVVFLLIERDDFGAAGVVAMILEDEGIAEDRIASVDIDDGFTGARLSGGTLALVSEADAPREGVDLVGRGGPSGGDWSRLGGVRSRVSCQGCASKRRGRSVIRDRGASV